MEERAIEKPVEFQAYPQLQFPLEKPSLKLKKRNEVIMMTLKSTVTILAWAAVALTAFGCYTEDQNHRREIYDPAGSEPGNYRDYQYYAPRDDSNYPWYYYDGRRYDDRYYRPMRH